MVLQLPERLPMTSCGPCEVPSTIAVHGTYDNHVRPRVARLSKESKYCL